MSDVQTRPRSTREAPPPPQPQNTQAPQDSKSLRFLNPLGRGAASVKRSGESTGEKISKGVEKTSDYINYKLSETDYLRRRQRFDELVAGNKDDGRLTDAIANADKWTKTIDKAVKDDKSNWTIRATMCTVATEDLLAGMKLARQGESKARAGNPAIRDGLDRVANALDAAKQHLTPGEHDGFSKELNALQVELAKLPATKPVKNAPPSPLEGKAGTLQDKIAKAITTNDERQNKLRLALDPLRTRLASAAGGTPDETTGADPRLTVSQLLTQADNAIFALEFTVAETAMKDAKTALDKMKAPQPKDLPSPQSLLDGITAMLKQTGGLTKQAGKLPEPAATELKNRIVETTGRLEAMEYALRKGGQSVIADANRTVEGCVGALNEIDETIKGYGEFQKSKKTADGEVTKLRQRVQGQAQSFYQKLGMAGGGDGAFQTRLADIQNRWTEAMKTSISLKELDQAAYMNELNALSDEVLNTTGNPDQIAVEKAASRYRTALDELRTEVDRVVAADSDKAIKLGLTTRPATLQKAGDALVTPKDSPLAPAERVKQIDAVTKQIAELTNSARGFDEKSIGFEAGELRKRCETLVAENRRRINAVLDAVEVERKKTISIGTNKAERDGLTKYGNSLLADVDTMIAPLDGLKPGSKLDAGLLGDAVNDLTGLVKRIADFEALGPQGKTDKSLPSFESLGKRAEALTKTLTTHSLFTARPELTEPWRTTLEAISGDITGRDPRQTDAALKKLETDIENAKKQAKGESKEAGAMVLRLRNLAADVVLGKNGLDGLGDDAPTYRKDLDRRLRKMADDIEAADKTNPAAQKLIDEVNSATKTSPGASGARGKGEIAAKKSQGEYDAAQFALERIKEVDLELLEEKAGRLKGEPRKELFKQAKDLRDQADAALKALEITRDVAAATTMAEAIADRITRISDAPLGSSTRARNNLPAVEKRWIKAVEILHRDIEAIPDIVKKACAGDTAAETAANAVTAKLVNPIKSVFRADAFTAIVKRIAAGDEKTLLTAREEALREVRRLTALMASDYRVHLLSKVPFDGAVSPFPEVGSALWDLETNLMTSG